MLLPVALCTAMLAIGFVVARLSGVDGSGLLWDYVLKSTAITLTYLMVWAFIEIAKLSRTNADRPLHIVARKLPKRLELIALPCLVFPLFLAGYTTAKTAIPFLVGFEWDRFWADTDAFLFGVAPWWIT